MDEMAIDMADLLGPPDHILRLGLPWRMLSSSLPTFLAPHFPGSSPSSLFTFLSFYAITSIRGPPCLCCPPPCIPASLPSLAALARVGFHETPQPETREA